MSEISLNPKNPKNPKKSQKISKNPKRSQKSFDLVHFFESDLPLDLISKVSYSLNVFLFTIYSMAS